MNITGVVIETSQIKILTTVEVQDPSFGEHGKFSKLQFLH